MEEDKEALNKNEDINILKESVDALKIDQNDVHNEDRKDPLGFHIKDSRLPGVAESLLTEGYAVLPSLLTKIECENSLSLIWEFIEDISCGKVRRTDPASWYHSRNINGNHLNDCDDPWPSSGNPCKADTFQSHGAGFLLGNVREILAERVFEPLYNTKRLHSSKEGFTLQRPNVISSGGRHYNHMCEKTQIYTNTPVASREERYSTNNHNFGSLTIQSSIAFLDQEETDGCFICYPQSHLYVHDLLKEKDCNGEVNQEQFYDDLVLSLEAEYNLKPKKIHVNAGDVIIWRSDLVHMAATPTITATNFCAIGYVSMLPSFLTEEKQLENKLMAYKLGQTGCHRPNLENHWHGHNRGDLSNLRPYFRFGPAQISWRLAELYGLISYNIENEEQRNKEKDRAIVRGVRFIDADLSSQYPQCKELLPKRGVPCSARVELLQPSYGPLLGQDKYLGGVASPCGEYIYGVCGHARRTLRVRCDTGEVDMIGPDYPGKFKWLRGVEIPANVMRIGMERDDEKEAYENYSSGVCLALPCNANSILKINPCTNEVSTFGGPFEGGWKWHGGNLVENGMVYAIPADTNRVLKIDPRTEETFFIGPDFGFKKQKWFGGIFAKTNGCIYGIPHNATGVLKINPHTDECMILGDGILPEGQWKWHGGLANLDGSKIYGFPNNAQEVLVIDTVKDILYTVTSPEFELKAGRHRDDDKYKWLGGALTLDGKYAYLFPCDAERILRIETETDTLKLIGPELLEGENKYQNGFAGKDGCIYAIPQRASSVLRVVPPGVKDNEEDNEDEDMVEMLYCGDSMVAVKDKFEGGVMGGKDGAIYCIPLRAKSVLRVMLQEQR